MKTLLWETWWAFRLHDGRLLSGALTFYVLLAVAPLGVIAVSVAGLIWGDNASAGELVEPLAPFVGAEMAAFVSSTIERASSPTESLFATVVGVGFMLFATFRTFAVLRMSLNNVFEVRVKIPLRFDRASLHLIYLRLRALGVVLVAGLLIPSSTLAKAGLVHLLRLAGGLPRVALFGEIVVSFFLMSTLVALVFKWVPDARLSWRDSLRGGLLTGALGTLGGMVAGQFLGRLGDMSAYGAAGTVVGLLIWTFYMSQIFFIGAEFTAARARHRGHGIVPRAHAQRVQSVPIDEDVDASAIRASMVAR